MHNSIYLVYVDKWLPMAFKFNVLFYFFILFLLSRAPKRCKVFCYVHYLAKSTQNHKNIQENAAV